jgi:Transglycosylase SLT domain
VILAVPYWSVGLGATTQQIQQQIVAQAQTDGIPPAVALAVAQHESQFIPTAQNPTSSAAGLFQLLSVTQQTLGVTSPYDPTQNINAGVGLLSTYYKQYGNWPQALQAYADGPGTVQQGLPPSTMAQGLIDYVNTYTPPAGLDLSTDDSSGFDLSSLTSGLDVSSLGLPDLSQSTIIDGVPDWMVWAGSAALGAGLLFAVVNR